MERHQYDAMRLYEESHWWYRVRRKIAHDLIRAHAPVGARLKILDIGCGAGALLRELNATADVTGVDIEPLAPGVRKGDLTRIPSHDGSFDIVLALDVLEHVEDDARGIAELARVLKPGGIAVLFVPAYRWMWGVTDEASHHFRRYTRAELTRKLRGGGFRILRASYFNTFLFLPIAAIRLLVRAFRIPVRSEFSGSKGWMNTLLFRIFLAESFVLRFLNFPSGVSVLVVARKPS